MKAKVIIKIDDKIMIGDAVDYSLTQEFRGIVRFRGNFIISRVVDNKANFLEELINILKDMFKREEK